MYYLEVIPISNQNFSGGTLTYAHTDELTKGTLVSLNVRGKLTSGVVWESTTKPTYNTKNIVEVLEENALSSSQLELMIWLIDYYPGPLGPIVKLFMPPAKSKGKNSVLSTKNKVPSLPKLKAEQLKAIKVLRTQPIGWLNGETGSGKTRVYQEFTAEALAKNQQVLLLSPEIGLSSQLFDQLREVFGDRVLHWHSNLGAKDRASIWHQVHSGRSVVVVGPRSALFLPYKKLGLIAIDEAHDDSYKQDQHPRYNALMVAAKCSKTYGCRVIYGSATPNVTDYWLAEQKSLPIALMSKQAVSSNTELESLALVDESDHGQFGASRVFSAKAVEAITKSISNDEQVLVLLNRRGSSRLVRCEDCSWRAVCDQCGVGLIYHHDLGQLICHSCGKREKMPTSCPDCRGVELVASVWGTKSVVTELQKLFPSQKIARFDSDNLASERLERNYTSLRSGETKIIIGTQMVGKGFDLPMLSTVVVLQADIGLLTPDYRASEKTFQLIKQVIGRVGRGHRDGRVVIQAKLPSEPSITSAVAGDFHAFYHSELKKRSAYHLPPYRFSAKLWSYSKNKATLIKQSEDLAQKLSENSALDVLGPAPALREKGPRGYCWQIVLFSSRRQKLTELSSKLPKNWIIDIDPVSLI